MSPHCVSVVLAVFCPFKHTHYASVLSIQSPPKSCSSPFGGLPHSVAVISVEVGGQLLLVVHTAGLDNIREAQRPESQRLRGLLNHLDVTASTCCVCLDEDGEDTASLSFLSQLMMVLLRICY